MVLNSPQDAMPWVGLYVAVASLICTIAMAADVFQGFRQWKLWFPCRFFTINAASITLIAIAMKLPMDLNVNFYHGDYDPKAISICFLITMLANFLPSLGLMDDKELVLNIIAFGILLITVTVNVFIQVLTKKHFMFLNNILFLVCFLPWPLSIALTISASRRIIEHRYKELYRLVSNSQVINLSYEELVRHVKRCWMMTESGNPQFLITSSPFFSASGVIFGFFAFSSIDFLLTLPWRSDFHGQSDYKWSIKVIVIMQSMGIFVGSTAPVFRCLTAISYFNLSKKWSMKYLNMLRVERYWTQRLRDWKLSTVGSYIPGRHCKMVFHIVKTMTLNVCITLQIIVVVISKILCLVPRSLLILFFCCLYNCNSLLKRFKKKSNESRNNTRLEIEEYTSYVLHVEEETKPSKRLLRNVLKSINHLLQEVEKNEPINLMKLLEKSTGFEGVVEFDNNQVPPLHPDETHNCWSLVIVTLTTIALALPKTDNGCVTELLASIGQGLQYIRHIEEILNANDELLDPRKAARRLWTQVEVYRKWLQIDVQKKSRNGKTSKEILQWLGDESVKIVINFKRCKKGSLSHSFYKFIAASSMYRISQSILLHYNKQENWPEDEVFEWISTIIADILLACFTNLPRVITMKCHHKTLKKRKENITDAAMLLGKSKRILNILEGRQLPNIDLDSMAYIDKWHAILKDEIPTVCVSSTSSQSVIINIV